MMGLGCRNSETVFTILVSLTISGCNSLRLVPKLEGGKSTALARVVDANTNLINELKMCLASKLAEINDLKGKQLDVSAVFFLDAKNSIIAESLLVRKDDDAQSQLAIENCRERAIKKASLYFREQVVKYGEMPTGFKDYKGKFYMNGTLRPTLDIVISDDPKGTENRAIFARARDSM